MPNIVCIGRDSISRTFSYEFDKDQFRDIWNFRVQADPPPQSGEFFDLSVEKVDLNTVQVIAMAHHDESTYMAKGIPEALLPVVKSELGMNVSSSPTKSPRAGVYRTSGATKVWERLRIAGLAIYNTQTDIYQLK